MFNIVDKYVKIFPLVKTIEPKMAVSNCRIRMQFFNRVLPNLGNSFSWYYPEGVFALENLNFFGLIRISILLAAPLEPPNKESCFPLLT